MTSLTTSPQVFDPMASFVAIDFETADDQPDSACAIGLVRVEQGQVVRREHRLIKPPRTEFLYTHIHGIRPEDVHHELAFGAVWEELAPWLEGVDFLAAHNAKFDHSVMNACCGAAGLESPLFPWVCTVELARAVWAPRSARLSVVCELLGIPLNHHHALSDAEACAQLVLASHRCALRSAA